MADTVPVIVPPLEPTFPPAPLSPTVPLNPPMVGVANPFEHVDAQNRDLILEAIRAWSRGSLLSWSGAWQKYLIEWLRDVKNWLDGWDAATVEYVTAQVAALDKRVTDAVADVVAKLAAQTELVDGKLAAQDARVAAELAAQEARLNAAIAVMVANGITANDPVIAGAIGTPGRQSRAVADSLYARSASMLNAAATVAIDYVGGTYVRDGVPQAPAAVLGVVSRAVALRQAPALRQAETNLLPVPFVGGVPGVSKYTTPANPANAGEWPGGIEANVNNAPKTIVEVTADRLRWSVSAADGGAIGSVMTTSGATPSATAEYLIAGRVMVSSPATGRPVQLEISWAIDGQRDGRSAVIVATSAEGFVDFRARLILPTNTAGTTRNIRFSPTFADGLAVPQGAVIEVSMENLIMTTIQPAPIGDYYSPAAYHTGTVAEATQTVTIANGHHILVADTDRGVLTTNWNVTGGLLNLLTVFGSVVIRRVWIMPRESYRPEMLDGVEPIKLVNVPYKMSPSLIGRALGKASNGKGGDIGPGGSRYPYGRTRQESPKALQVAANRRGYFLVDVSPGDVATADAEAAAAAGKPPTTERSEIVDVVPMPAGVEFWTAFTLVWHSTPTANGNPHIVYQERYTNVVGDNSALSPELALVFIPGDRRPSQPLVEPSIRLTGRYNAAAPVQFALFDIPWDPTLINVPMSFVFRLKFGRDTAGAVQVWRDGVELVNAQPIIGYDKPEGVQPHAGIYRGAHSDNNRSIVSFHNWERTTASLAARVERPLPMLRPAAL